MEIKLSYSYNQDNVMRESIEIPSSYHDMVISVKTSERLRRYGLLLELKDNNGNTRVKKLISNNDEIKLSPCANDTTVGGVSGIITPGRWYVTLYVFTEYIAQEHLTEGFDVILNFTENSDAQGDVGEFIRWSSVAERINTDYYDWNRCYNDKKGWYKGDFHTHTNLSDGEESILQATKNAKKSKLDFYLPTEHNLVHTGWVDTDVCIVPGIEVTAKEGHFNIFGVKRDPRYVEDVMVKSDEYYIDKIIEDAHNSGEIVSINHPFLTKWKWLFENTNLSKVNTIEIVNDPTYHAGPDSNDLAIKFMDILWDDGHRIYALGGSDSHNRWGEAYEGAKLPSIVGDPGTFVYMESLTPNNIITAVKAGHAYVTRFCSLDVAIYSKDKSYLPGDEITSLVCYELAVVDAAEDMDIYLVQNSGYTKLDVTKTDVGQSVKVDVDVKGDYGWARMEIRNKDNEFRGYTNPIYWGSKATKLKTFIDAKRLMEELL